MFIAISMYTLSSLAVVAVAEYFYFRQKGHFL